MLRPKSSPRRPLYGRGQSALLAIKQATAKGLVKVLFGEKLRFPKFFTHHLENKFWRNVLESVHNLTKWAAPIDVSGEAFPFPLCPVVIVPILVILTPPPLPANFVHFFLLLISYLVSFFALCFVMYLPKKLKSLFG